MRRMWAGMASSGHIAMTMEDREIVGRRARRQAAWLVLALIGPFVSLALGALVLYALPQPIDLVLGCAGLGLVVPAASLLAAGDAWKRWRALRLDLARGELEVLEGKIGAAVSVDPVLKRLLRDGVFGTDPERMQRVEILAASGFVHRAGEVLVERFVLPDVLEVAEGRPSRPTLHGDTPSEREIALTEAERRELRVRAAQHWRTPVLTVGVMGYVALGAVMWGAGGSEWLARYGAIYAAWALAGGFAAYQLARRYLTARRLEQDAELGDAIEVVQTDARGTTHRVVVLPHSRMVWSVNDLPAEWRSTRA